MASASDRVPPRICLAVRLARSAKHPSAASRRRRARPRAAPRTRERRVQVVRHAEVDDRHLRIREQLRESPHRRLPARTRSRTAAPAPGAPPRHRAPRPPHPDLSRDPRRGTTATKPAPAIPTTTSVEAGSAAGISDMRRVSRIEWLFSAWRFGLPDYPYILTILLQGRTDTTYGSCPPILRRDPDGRRRRASGTRLGGGVVYAAAGPGACRSTLCFGCPQGARPSDRDGNRQCRTDRSSLP